MQAFLQAPEVTEKKDKLVKVWAEQVRDLSYDMKIALTSLWSMWGAIDCQNSC